MADPHRRRPASALFASLPAEASPDAPDPDVIYPRARVLADVDARPERSRVEAIAAAGYAAALAAQQAGRPDREVYAILRAFGRYRLEWDAATLANLAADAPDAPH